MKTNHILFLATIFVAVMLSSCNKDKPSVPDTNPPTQNLPGASFSLSAVESRNGHDYPWTISKSGVTDSVEETIDQMYVTEYNTLIVKVTPDGGGIFPGFNVRSSKPKAVEVVVLDNSRFQLKRPTLREGDEATIEVWNGSGSNEHKVSFKVKAKQMIEPTAFVFEVDGKRIEVPLYDNYKEGDKNAVTILTIPESEKDANTDVIHKIVCAGVVPENASFDYAQIGPVMVEEEWVDWLKGQGKDFTFYTGVNAKFEGPLTELMEHNTMYTCLRRFGSVSDQYEAPIRIVLSRNKSSIGQKYGSAYVYLPFSTMDEYVEWADVHW